MTWFVLKNNYFECDSRIKQQVSGTAIAITFSPPYTCIFKDRVGTEFLENEHLKLWVWQRYIDDIFFVWIHVESELSKFLERLNSFDRHLKIILEYTKEEINYLDVTLKLNNNQFNTDLYYKTTGSHQYLPYNSCKLEQMNKSRTDSQGFRIKRLQSDATSLTNNLNDVRSWFCNRGYTKSMVIEQLKRIENRTRDELLCTNSCVGKGLGISLIIIYHQHVNGK